MFEYKPHLLSTTEPIALNVDYVNKNIVDPSSRQSSFILSWCIPITR